MCVVVWLCGAGSVKPLDEEYLLSIANEYNNIFVLEEAIEQNGFASSVMDFYNENCISKLIYKIGIKTGNIPHGNRGELLEEFGLRGENLIKRIEEKIDAGKK